MIGVLVTTHGNVGEELIKAVEMIKGPSEGPLILPMAQTRGEED